MESGLEALSYASESGERIWRGLFPNVAKPNGNGEHAVPGSGVQA
jgi:hypothetical protein